MQPHPINSRSGKLHKHMYIRWCLPRHLEGPSLLEALTNTALQWWLQNLRDCERELNLSPCARSIHNFRRIQSTLGRMLSGPNRKRSLHGLFWKQHNTCSPREQQRGNTVPSACQPYLRSVAGLPSKGNSDLC